ncbi:aldehyde ferredoxin oxidoreductase family protein [Desulfosediminicola ganghwensis]|uniref:aldehyde ferredoxin oxidoreductase family protein n=1 Tax=Desulfosediminicola ganghwensis TaxID=2569540 RepID=UPI0010AC39DE|nr:aldehyde ferredoxin oxidoreductase family protein [Desulfosediminicola ganghwensis]
MGNGYWGKVLRIDLTTKKTTIEEVGERVWKLYLGGGGFGAKVLSDEVGSEVGPYDAENRLVFATGPLQAARQTGAAKFTVVSKSPVTGIYGESAAGAGWGMALKNAGYDALIIQGKSESPCYLKIDEDLVEICEAAQFWGKDAFEASDAIVADTGLEKSSICSIGQAGEKKVAIACIVVDKHSFAGRCGLGAVMGSKNLKAVVVNGTRKVAVNKPEKLAEINKSIGKTVHENTKDWLRLHGTPFVEIGCDADGDTPTKNWSEASWPEGAEKLGVPNYTDVLGAKPHACSSCVVGCHREVEVAEPEKYAMKGPGPEYEALGMLGNNCLMDDVKALSLMNDLCNRYGLDCISMGSFLGYTMDCQEKGLMTADDIGGVELKWGDADTMIELIHNLGNRKSGFGELFADGLLPAAEKLGEEAVELAPHVKGLDLPAHDPRAFFSLAVNYATGNVGPHHERGNPQVATAGFLLPEAGVDQEVDRFQMENSEFVAAKYQDYGTLTQAACHCKFMLFGGYSMTVMLDSINAITGWEWSMDDLLKAAERIYTLQRMVNVKYGIDRKDDKLPAVVYKASENGSRAGKVPHNMDEALDRYYELRGWDDNGVPKSETLEALGIQI